MLRCLQIICLKIHRMYKQINFKISPTLNDKFLIKFSGREDIKFPSILKTIRSVVSYRKNRYFLVLSNQKTQGPLYQSWLLPQL